ncbi:Druantia anti-phage system protein DruA [Brevundimonas sp.]|uniref:Druantia anti-phage system protein DruA n=1 Tax=Brevundimonas sp. TaxID=1871086 RepID=UPI0028B068C8|nr:Druantia anti-phage system protein DruA [Brevundimonas sp.]
MQSEDKYFGKAGRQRSISPTLHPRAQTRLFNVLKIHDDTAPKDFASALRKLAREWIDDSDSVELRATSLLVADLSEQGWRIDLTAEGIVFEPPGLARGAGTVDDVKARVQRTLRVGRDRQLREPSVKAFITRMERPAPGPGDRKYSVLDLIDSGSKLADALAAVSALPEAERAAAAKGVIDPVVELCEAGARCASTGLPLIDIWRYFRHTWSHEYRSIPGRQMMVLIRNAARPLRPVIGIAMLASPVMRLGARDAWIGWLRPAAQDLVERKVWRPAAFARSLAERLDASIRDLRWDDLASAEEIEAPTEAVVFRLQQKAYGAAYQREVALREAYAGEAAPKPAAPKPSTEDADWTAASEDLLFVRKRAESLAELLYAKLVLWEFDLSGRRATKEVARLFESKRGQRAVDIALTEFRKAGLSSRIADVSVCGAVHPYNEVLGGKLVTLLLCSQEVRDLYAKRYGGHVSVIASQMAGRPIWKPADLRILTTTSLYGTGSSQYNRLILKAADHKGLKHDLRWSDIGRSLTGGYGTLHLSQETVQALRTMGEQHHDARRVNNRFGEGTSPRLRQIREGLDALGIESDHVLHHATPRIFYACELEPNARASLLQATSAPLKRAPSVKAIAEAWRRRWLLRRIDNRDVDLGERMHGLGPASVQAVFRPNEDGQLILEFDQ